MNRLDYNGEPVLNKERRLTEPVIQKAAPKPKDPEDILQENVTKLFDRTAKTFLKGHVLRKALANMEPAQWIPVSSPRVAAAIRRLDDSLDGTKIPFSFYTEVVDRLAEKQWQLRRIYDRVSIPPDSESQTKLVDEFSRNKSRDLISRFITGDGVAGALVMMLGVTLFQIPGFNLLAIENGAKGYFTAQVPLALAIMIELGIKMARIKELLKVPNIEGYEDLEENTAKRRQILENAGISYEELKQGTEWDDCKLVVQYVRDYIANTDAGVKYDHWVAYGNVVARQNILRAALDTAPMYSRTYQEDLQRFPTKSADVSEDRKLPINLALSPVLASHINVVLDESDSAYNDIYNIFSAIPTIVDFCCLAQLFKELDTESLETLGRILMLLSVDLNGELIDLQDAFYSMITNMASAAVYKLAAEMNAVADDIMLTMLRKLAAVEEELNKKIGLGAPACPAFLDIGIALSISIENIKTHLQDILANVQSQILSLNRPQDRTITVLGDRRYLYTLGKFLQAIAVNLEAAKACEAGSTTIGVGISEDILTSLIEDSPPTLSVSEEDKEKHFSDIGTTASKIFPNRRYGGSPDENGSDLSGLGEDVKRVFDGA